jgi:hypothetical protein
LDPAASTVLSGAYAYASANPMVFVDVTGLWSMSADDVQNIAGIISTIAWGIAAVAAVTGVGAPVAAIASGIALAAGAVSAVAAATKAFDTCTGNTKGSCGDSVGMAALEAASILPGARLIKGAAAGAKTLTGASKAADEFVDLASTAQRTHILDGHRFGGEAGNSWFPKSWSDDKIMHSISDVATDPKLAWVRQTGPLGAVFTKRGKPVKFLVEGVRDEVKIRVILQPGGEGIVTGFPIK